MNLTINIPKPLYKVGDKYTSEYGYLTTIVSPAKLEVQDHTKFGELTGITLEYYYGIEIDLTDRKEVYYISEEYISKDYKQVEQSND